MKLRPPLAALSALLALSAVAPAFAQDPAPAGSEGKGGRQNRQARRGGARNNPVMAALRALNLPQEQQTKVDEVLKKSQEEQRAAFQNGEQRPAPGAMQARQQKLISDIEAVLTPEQKTQFQAELAKQTTSRAAGMFLQRLEPLNLTAEQKTKVEPIVTELMAEMAKVREDDSLKGKEKREKQAALLDGMKAKVRPLLTAEQQTKFDTMDWNQRGAGGAGRGPRGGANGANGGNTPTR